MNSKKFYIFLIYFVLFSFCTLVFLVGWFFYFIKGFTDEMGKGFRLIPNSEVEIIPKYPKDLMIDIEIMEKPISFTIEHSEENTVDSVCVGTQLIFFLETDRTQTYCEEDSEYLIVERGSTRDNVTLYPRKQFPIDNSIILYIQTIDSYGNFNWRVVYFATVDTLFTFLNITLGYIILIGLVGWFPFKMIVGAMIGRVPMGFVYDSVTKRAISLSVVRVFDNKNKLIMTTVTDIKGYFKIRLPIGFYKVEVFADGYSFPSRLAYPLKNIDVNYRIYYGEMIKISKEEELLSISVPMDPVNSTDNKFKFWINKILFTYFATNIVKMVGFFAFLSFLILLIFGFSEQNIYEFILMAIGITLFFVFYFFNQVKYGYFVDENGNGLENITFDVYDNQFNQFIVTTTSDKDGRFVLSIPRGEYYMKLRNKNYTFVKNGYDNRLLFSIHAQSGAFFRGKTVLKKMSK